MDPFISQLAELARRYPTRNKWVFVPSHAIGRTIGERIALEGTNWANLRFVTPLDIAVRMAGPFLVEQGVDPSEDGLGPALIMRLLMALPEEHTYFRPLAEQPSMAQALWSTIREMRMAGIHASDIESNADAFESAQKHSELVALVHAYEQYLADRKISDIPAVYEYAPKHHDYCPILEGDLWTEHPDAVWAPLQRDLLDTLPGERIAPAVLDPPVAPEPRRWKFLRRDVQAVVAAPTCDAEHLAFLLRPADAPAPRQDGSLSLFRAGGREAEIEEVFRRILSAGTSLDQVEIACASDEYAPLIWEKACRLEWPVTIATGIPAALTRPGRALIGWCEWIEGNFAAADLRHLLQSGDVTLGKDAGLSGGQAARLLARAEATWGRDTYHLAFTRLERSYRSKSRDPERTEDLRRAAQEKAQACVTLRDWIVDLLSAVPVPAPAGGKIALRAVTEAALRFLDACCACASALDGFARQQLVESVGELRALDDFQCSIVHALGFIRERANSASVGVDRPRPGHLYISSLSQCAYPGRPHLFIVGLEEGRVFPSGAEDPVLLSTEREAIGPRVRRASDKVDELQFQIVTRLACATPARDGRVCFSYSCRDTRQYRESLPSWLVLRVARLASGNAAMNYEKLEAYLGDPVSWVPTPRDRALSASRWWVSSVKDAETAAEPLVLVQFPSLKSGREADDHRNTIEEFSEYDGFVPAAGSELDPSATGASISATTLEAAAKCPFRYFVEHGLGIDPVGDPRRDRDLWLDPLTRGGELHNLFAELMRRCQKEGRKPDPEKDKWLVDRASERLDVLSREMPPPSDPVFERERADFLHDVELFIAFEARRTEGTPIAFEVAFGRRHSSGEEDSLAQDAPVKVSVGNGREVLLNGRIDRIDKVGKSLYDIIDYKTGGYWPDDWRGTFAGGTRLQHALYGLAAVELLRAKDPAASIRRGVYLFPSAKGGGRTVRIPRPATAKTEAVLRDLLDVMAAGVFVHTDTEGECRFCDFANACGAGAPARATQKIENRAEARLDPVRRLASHE